MAVLTLVDQARRLDPNGGIPIIAETLSKTNDLLQDVVYKESNLPTGHQSTIRTGLPTATWKRFYQGVQPTKSATAQVVDGLGILNAISQVDLDEADLNGNTKEFRASEDAAQLEGMNQAMANAFFYGDTTVAPEQFNGLAPRFNSLSASNAKNIVNAGGTTAGCTTSVWLVVHGEQTVFGIFPKGSKAGFSMTDDGVQSVTRSDGSVWKCYQSDYKWKNGLVVKDWRYVVRVANIDTASIASYTSATDIIKMLVIALDKIPNIKMGKAAIYMNREIHTILDIQAMSKTNVHFSFGKDMFGQPLLEFRGIPCRMCEAILNTEAIIS